MAATDRETDYLRRSPKNARRVLEAIQRLEARENATGHESDVASTKTGERASSSRSAPSAQ